MDAFYNAVKTHNLKIVSATPHPTIKGLTHIEYQVPALDGAGNPLGRYKGGSPLQKTVYDPKLWSDDDILSLGQLAAATGYQNAISSGARAYSSTAGGIKFRVYLENGVVTNVHPEF